MVDRTRWSNVSQRERRPEVAAGFLCGRYPRRQDIAATTERGVSAIRCVGSGGRTRSVSRGFRRVATPHARLVLALTALAAGETPIKIRSWLRTHKENAPTLGDAGIVWAQWAKCKRTSRTDTHAAHLLDVRRLILVLATRACNRSGALLDD